MAAEDHLSPQFLDLYHRTGEMTAIQIHRDRRFESKTNPGGVPSAYFSTHPHDEQTEHFGRGLVHVRVPAHIAEIDDEFPSGVQHYTVPVKKIRPHHFIDD